MTSQKQIDANRRNAQKSTGPKTPEGKAAVRLNALKHGLRARAAVGPGENAEEFHQLCADLESDWQPRNRTEQALVEEMAVSHWKLARAEEAETRLMLQGPLNKDRMALIVQVSQYQARLKRAFMTALHELQKLQQTAALTEPVQPEQPAGPPLVSPPPPAPAESPEPVQFPTYVMTSPNPPEAQNPAANAANS